jgi:hypothetical protein
VLQTLSIHYRFAEAAYAFGRSMRLREIFRPRLFGCGKSTDC